MVEHLLSLAVRQKVGHRLPLRLVVDQEAFRPCLLQSLLQDLGPVSRILPLLSQRFELFALWVLQGMIVAMTLMYDVEWISKKCLCDHIIQPFNTCRTTLQYELRKKTIELNICKHV